MPPQGSAGRTAGLGRARQGARQDSAGGSAGGSAGLGRARQGSAGGSAAPVVTDFAGS